MCVFVWVRAHVCARACACAAVLVCVGVSAGAFVCASVFCGCAAMGVRCVLRACERSCGASGWSFVVLSLCACNCVYSDLCGEPMQATSEIWSTLNLLLHSYSQSGYLMKRAKTSGRNWKKRYSLKSKHARSRTRRLESVHKHSNARLHRYFVLSGHTITYFVDHKVGHWEATQSADCSPAF